METISTQGIVIHHLKYSDSGIIAKIFTKEAGLHSYIVKGVRKEKSKTKAAWFQPLTLLDLVVLHSDKRTIQYIKEVAISQALNQISIDIRKSSLSIFIAELMYKSIKEELSNKQLFDFLQTTIVKLNEINIGFAIFHLWFAINLTKYLGFYPQKNYSEDSYFDLSEGVFSSLKPEHELHLNKNISKLLFSLMELNIEELHNFNISKTDRKILLESLFIFYKIHISNFGTMKSHLVLEEVFA